MQRFPISRLAALTARSASFCLIVMTALMLLGFDARRANATIHYVTTTGTGNGSSWAMAGPLQTVIAATASGDQVWVKKGTYTGTFTATDGVAVYGGFAGTETMLSQRNVAANPTILDSNSSGTIYSIPNGSSGTNTLDGFTLQHGSSASGYGSGVFNQSGDTLVIANCAFTDNDAAYGGGGIFDESGTTTVTNCTFTGNTTDIDYGGSGIFADGDTITVTGCTFTNNTESGGNSINGGGIFASHATSTITNCKFTDNQATHGGGAYYSSGTATLSGCTFTSNTVVSTGGQGAGGGGGVNANGTTITITGCTFTDNGATGTGGNPSLGGGLTLYLCGYSVTGCTFTGNTTDGSGGGVNDTSGTGTVTACTFTDNTAEAVQGNDAGGGGGLEDTGNIIVARCTFRGNSPDAVDLTGSGSSSYTTMVKDSLIVGTGTGTSTPNGIDLDPDPGGEASMTSYVTVANDTIVDTNVGITVGSTTAGAIGVANTILDGNGGGLMDMNTVPFTSSHNDVYNNVTYGYQGVSLSSSDLTVNPQFVSGGYQLAVTSPLINAGDDSYVMSGDKDLNGHSRIGGAHVDIGAYEATPTITSFTPASGPVGTVITVTGMYLNGVTAVRFHNANATTFSANSAGTQLTVTVPSGAGTGTITVTTPDGSGTSVTPFTVIPPPAITSFTPTSGPVGTVVTITGTAFTGASSVKFHGTAAPSYTVVSDTSITATVPTGATTGTISVTTVAGTSTSSGTFTVIPAPTITSFTPTSGSSGTTVTITGTNFTGTTAVTFNGAAAASFTVNSATQITATVPSGATTGTISVTTPGGTAISSGTFTVDPAPTITAFSPQSGPIGTVVTITGTNLNGVTAVRFHNASATVFSANDAGTQLTVTVPSGAGTGTITVTTPNGVVKTATAFTVVPAPTITSFSPESGPAGTVVTITGMNLNGVTAVRFHNASAKTFSANEAGTQLTVTVPSGAATGTITVTTPGGVVKTATNFTVN